MTARKLLVRLDRLVFAGLLFLLAGIALPGGRANIQTDAIDYYAILQRLVGDTPPVVAELPFLEQRSPGYPLLAVPVYYALGLVNRRVTPQRIQAGPVDPASVVAQPSERALLPEQPLRFKDVFFKNFDLAPQGGVFRWRVIAALLLTSYGLFFTGLIVSGKTLALLYSEPVGFCLAPVLVITSAVFMHNLVNTPAYATLAVYGASSLFTWFWVLGWQTRQARVQWAAGLFAGLMVLVRLETVLIVIVLAGALAVRRETQYLRSFALGGLPPLALLLGYNLTQFGNLWHAGIFKGNMNLLAFDLSYLLSVLVRPQSGLLFWSTLVVLGITGLFFSPLPSLRPLGWAALALIALIALRIPVMYFCTGQGSQVIEGLIVTCPPDSAAMLDLIRLDANRYLAPLVPFAVLGLRGLPEAWATVGQRRHN
jgi:hypothetical protein